MAETIHDLRGLPRAEAWQRLRQQALQVLEGIDDDVAAMATMSSLISSALGFLWVGFYRVVRDGSLLRVGPYQGTLGCLEIAFGRGVCGTAAAQERTVIVPDVEAFDGHIACDARSRSEIVVPVFDPNRRLLAVLDIDSSVPSDFTDVDRTGLEELVGWFAGERSPPRVVA